MIGKKIRLLDFFAAPTVEGLAALLRESGYASNWSSLVPIQPRGSKPPFFWVHGDGSNFLLPACLGEDQPFYGFMHQSQDGTPARYTTVEEIAAHYLEELCSVQPEGPYFLGGYSFGGLVAFEMAQQLRSRGDEAAFLALLEATSNHIGASGSYEQPQEIKAAGQSSGNSYHRLRRHLANLRSLNVAQQVVCTAIRMKRLLEQVSRFPKLKRASKRMIYRLCEKTGRQMPRSVRRAYLMNLYNEAARGYNPDVYPARVVLFTTLKDPRDLISRWDRLVTGGLEVHSISGDHTSIIEEPQLRGWAEKLGDCLNKAQGDLSAGN
jgi:thioesterase domain-containing protein